MLKDLGTIYGARLICLHFDGWADARGIGELQEIEAGFDCFLVNRSEGFDGTDNALVKAIVSRGGLWVEIFGCAAETIHDAIDAASVSNGRQSNIGDGNPMTTWKRDMDDSVIGAYILSGGQGESNTKVLIVVGASRLVEYLTLEFAERGSSLTRFRNR